MRVVLTDDERRQRRREIRKRYINGHRDQINEYRRKRNQDPIVKAKRAERNALIRDKFAAWARASNRRIRATVLEHYGNKCACCGEDEQQFLGIDHIHGGGKRARKTQGMGANLYRWIIKNNYPDGFQLLCHNCNLAKGFYGMCPHKKGGLALWQLSAS